MRRSSRPLALAVLLALLLHVGVVLYLGHLRVSQPAQPNPAAAKAPIRVNLAPKTADKSKQLVKIKPPNEERIPRTADYRSEYNAQVDRQTRAKNQSADSSSPARTPQAPQAPKLGQGSLPRSLMPSWSDLESREQASSTDFNDNLSPVKEGAETQLNTFEWKHASYFNRIKEGVSRNWKPLWQIRRYDPAGALVGKQDRLTVLSVTIDNTGNLASTEVVTSSGVFYLDDEAQSAFRKAAPFPHPPAALFAHSERFSFNFGFMVSLNRGFTLDFD